MKQIIGIFLFLSCFWPANLLATNIDQVLIITDIGPYKLEHPFVTSDGLVIGGGEPKSSQEGNGAEGFYSAYTVGYDGGDNLAGPDIEIRIYDSPQWMLRDLESDLKEYQDGVATVTDTSAITKIIDNNPVIKMRAGGGVYRWISGNKAIFIEYHDLQLEYPIPMEVISAYLAKYPSTLPATYQIRHPDREKQFIREEFERLITVAGRWVDLIQADDPEKREKLKSAATNLMNFAKYRKVYFSSMLGSLLGGSMDEDINLLQTAHMGPDLETIVRTKLTEYQEWWASHENDSISFP